MSFSFWGQWDSPSINFDFRPAGYLVLFLYLIFLTWLLYRERRALVKLTLTRTLVWLVCIFLSLLLSTVFVFQLAPARAHIAPVTGWHSLALLAGLPIVLAGAVGIFPAALVGLAGGLVQSLWLSHQPFNAFEMAIWGAVTAYLVRQDYRGHLPRLLRLPLVASPVAALVVWATYWLSCVSSTSGDLLSSVLRCWTPLGSSLPLTWVGGVMAGLIVQVLFLALPVQSIPQ